MFIYHITTNAEWLRQQPLGSYTPADYAKDGFIHCSTSDQVQAIANRFYHGQTGLVLLVIESSKLDTQVIFENLEGGSELFPHIYGPLPVSAVEKALSLLLNSNQSFDFSPVFE